MKNIFLIMGLFFGLVFLVSAIPVYDSFITYLLFILVFGVFLIIINFLMRQLL